MADKKISALTAASTPLAGTEVLPIVQSGATVKVAVSSLSSFGPAFSAYAGTSTNLTTGAETKVLFDTEEFDTNANFATSRFTPTVAGYYQINACIRIQGLLVGNTAYAILYKNGASYKVGQLTLQGVAGNPTFLVSTVVYLNGSTDYVEIYAFQNSGVTLTTQNAQSTTYFNGTFVRGA
jgi:hypothetical protein